MHDKMINLKVLAGIAGLVIAMSFQSPAGAQSFHVTLTSEVSSKMASGSPFTAKDEATGKIYTGRVISQKARNFLRRGWVRLSFDQPIHVVDGEGEGTLRPGHKQQIILLGTTPLIAKIADDAVDKTISPGKARLVAVGAAAVVLFFMPGGNITLKPGYKIAVEPDR